MKTETKEILGFKVPVVGIVESLDEAVSASGSAEAVLADFNRNVLAHSHYAILRRAIVKKLVELTGVKMKTVTTGEGDAKKEKVDETDGEYVARLEQDIGEETLLTYSDQLAAVCAAVPVDYKPGVRGTGASDTPAAKWLAYYDQLVKESKLDRFCSKNGIDTGLPEAELKVAVANKAKEIVTAKMREAAAQAMAV